MKSSAEHPWSVGEVAERFSLPTNVLRHWESVGLLTPERVHELLPETAGLAVEVHPLPNLRAVNVVIHGLLGRGVADSTSLDPQAKGLGEHLRARLVT